MAIGLGKMFGFTLKENFNYPYIAKSARDSGGGGTCLLGVFSGIMSTSLSAEAAATWSGICSWLVPDRVLAWCKLWNFVLWGLYFGLLILLERLFLARLLEALPGWFSHCI